MIVRKKAVTKKTAKKRAVTKKRAHKRPAKAVTSKPPTATTPKKRVTKRKAVKKKATKQRIPRLVWTQAMADTICERLAEGESLVSICSDKAMPCYATVQNQLGKDDGFVEKYARAREDQADKLVDEIISIADEDPERVVDAQGIKRIDPASVNHNRLRLDARKWVASKLKPKKYGDKLEVGGTGGGPIRHAVEITYVDADGSSPDTTANTG